ncbi:MAG TPA: NADH-quinone oxidoreductase subunit H, partial [Anaerolineaceae bacterium]
GGWQGPGANAFPILGLVYFGIKTALVYFLTVLIRGSLPRFRIDQMMDLNWKVLTPLSLAVVMVSAVLAKITSGGSTFVRWIFQLAASLVIAWIGLEALRFAGRHEREIELMPIEPHPRTETDQPGIKPTGAHP